MVSEAWKAVRAKQAPPRTKDDRWHAFTVCIMCANTKRLTEFHKKGNGQKYKAGDPRRYKSTCADCIRMEPASSADPEFKPDRKKRAADSKRIACEKHAGRNRAIRRRTRIRCLNYLAKQGCQLCGERDPRVLEFDHLDPSKKEHTISTLISGGYSWANETLRREIRKCRILCANCHRKHTLEQQSYYSHPDVKTALGKILRDYNVG